jgi:serine/threonine protein kinase
MTSSVEPQTTVRPTPPTMRYISMEKSYNWHEKLGSGGTGVVYCVSKKEDPSTLYAAKLFHSGSWTLGQAGIEKENLKRAEKAPHTIRFHGIGFFQKSITLLTTFVAGPTLLQHIPKCTIEHIRQTVQILEFLTNIHEHGCTYFDLKPENVIFNDNDNDMRVVDLGSMYPISRCTSGLVGTNFYRSLSIWLNGPYDTSIDMWAFGLLLFELFTRFPLIAIAGEDSDPLTVNKYVNLIVAQFGMPPASVLEKLKDTALFFNKDSDGYVLKNPLNVKITPWKSYMRAYRTNVPSFQREQLINLIERCLQYENALTAQQALSHPFFTSDITHFSIVLSQPILSRYTLYISEGKSPHYGLIKVRLSEMYKLDCLHIKTQLKGRYIVCLRKSIGTEVIDGPCSLYLNKGDRLIIRKNRFDNWVFSTLASDRSLTEVGQKRRFDTTLSTEELQKLTS